MTETHKTKSLIEHLLFIIIIISIVFHGSYFPNEYLLVVISLIIIALWYYSYHDIKLNYKSIILFLFIIIGYTIPIFTMNADIKATSLEIIKFLCFGIALVILSEKKHNTFNAVYFGTTIVSILGLMAYLRMLNFNEWILNDNGLIRLQSTPQYANVTAMFLAIGCILANYHMRQSKDTRIIHLFFMLINFTALILTFSRFALVSFFVIIMIIIWLTTKYSKLMKIIFYISIPVLITAVSYIFYTGKEGIILGSTFVSRLIYWYDGFLLLLKNPFGVGAGGWELIQYSIQTADYSVKYVHNSFLQIALDGGFIALFGLVALIILGIINLYKIYRKENDKLYAYLLGILLLLCIHGFFDIDFSFAGILLVLGIVVGFSFKKENILKSKQFVFGIGIPLIIICLFCIRSEVINGQTEGDINAMYGYYEQKHEQNINDVFTLSELFSISYALNDIGSMYEWSKKWVSLAPRQQRAYEAHLLSLDKMIEISSENIYEKEKEALYKQVEYMNSTMNPLSKYLTKNKKITLPKY